MKSNNKGKIINIASVWGLGGGAVKGPQFLQKIKERTLIHEIGQPEDLKGAALFLASPASDFVTGQVLVVDDGYCVK